ncbi:hypothetical protein [Achromobacter xylosoxidans]|uniref:hypothetical protein n=1 Tax=Alcaligenes xylosoxydans xylosoxydans TaxID=85698 RepID=UPI0022B862BD|nr:hypothetical protein [Achromobacter xylosoxidans]MCZ8388682.1 hypothetical protein [Achromobacter xylosoxidans]
MTVRATANARPLGSRQADALQNIQGSIDGLQQKGIVSNTGALAGSTSSPINTVPTVLEPGNHGVGKLVFNASLVARTASETRPVNTAYHPRLHV